MAITNIEQNKSSKQKKLETLSTRIFFSNFFLTNILLIILLIIVFVIKYLNNQKACCSTNLPHMRFTNLTNYVICSSKCLKKKIVISILRKKRLIKNVPSTYQQLPFF